MAASTAGRSGRSTTQRDLDRAVIRRTKPPCGICGEPIDYALRYPDPMSFVVDHIHPYAKGGTDDITNKQAAHNTCNRLKWDRIEGETGPRVFVTTRTW